MTTAAFTAVLTVYLVRALGPSGYGVFVLAIGVGTLAMLPSDFGLSQSVARFIAERRSDPVAARDVFSQGLRLRLLAGAIASVGLFAVAGPIASAYGNHHLVSPLRWVALAVFAQGLVGFFSGVFVAFRKVSVALRMVFVESVVEASASIVLVLLGAGATGAVLGRACGYVVGALVGLVLASRLIGRPRIGRGNRGIGIMPSIARYAGAMLIIDAAYTAINQFDVILIGALLGSAAVGKFGAVVRLISFLGYVGSAVTGGVAPRLARGPGEPPDVKTFASALRFVVVFQAALIAPLVVWADPIVDVVLGSGYAASADVMRVLAPSAFLIGIAPLVSISVNFLGEARRRVPILLVTMVLSFGLTVLLINTVGLLGAAVANVLTMAAYVGAHLWICRRLLGLELWPLAVSLGRGLTAAGAMGLVLVAVGTSSLSAVQLVGGATAGVLVFCVTLLTTREVSLDELRSASRMVTARLGRSPA
jgi:O-antigen/teichoic acid export membrane protein